MDILNNKEKSKTGNKRTSTDFSNETSAKLVRLQKHLAIDCAASTYRGPMKRLRSSMQDESKLVMGRKEEQNENAGHAGVNKRTKNPDSSRVRSSSAESLPCSAQLTRIRATSQPRTSTEEKNVRAVRWCFQCNKEGAEEAKCPVCPRYFHSKCSALTQRGTCAFCDSDFVENSEQTSPRRKIKPQQLRQLLLFTIQQLKNISGSEIFHKPVDPTEHPQYEEHISNPMDFELLTKRVQNEDYGYTGAFLADVKWILHNSIIYNGARSEITKVARQIVRHCKQEVEEIEKCSDCYFNCYTRWNDWFIQVCKKPHLLIWARLRGYPFWPAKVMAVNEKSQQVDAKFFGGHEKAWVNVKDCFLLSENRPMGPCKNKAELDAALEELRQHISIIEDMYGSFVYAPDRSPVELEKMEKKLFDMVPGFIESPSKQHTDANATIVNESPGTENNILEETNDALAGIRVENVVGGDKSMDWSAVSESPQLENVAVKVRPAKSPKLTNTPSRVSFIRVKSPKALNAPLENMRRPGYSPNVTPNKKNRVPYVAIERINVKRSTNQVPVKDKNEVSQPASAVVVTPVTPTTGPSIERQTKKSAENGTPQTTEKIIGQPVQPVHIPIQPKPVSSISNSIIISKALLTSPTTPGLLPSNATGTFVRLAKTVAPSTQVTPILIDSIAFARTGLPIGRVSTVGISSPAVTRSPHVVPSPAARPAPTNPMPPPLTSSNFPGSDIAPISRFGTKMFEAYYTMAEELNQEVAASSNVQEQLNLKKENERLNVELEAKSKTIVDYEKKCNDLKRETEDLKKWLDESKKKLEETKKNINEIKRKQWCANCNREAMYYCCWNTSYCDYSCQQSHWPKHMTSCIQAAAPNVTGPVTPAQTRRPVVNRMNDTLLRQNSSNNGPAPNQND